MADFDLNAIGLTYTSPELDKLRASVSGGASQATRVNRFDRADFGARKPLAPQSSTTQAPPQTLSATAVALRDLPAASPATEPQPQPSRVALAREPLKSDAQVTADHLSELGWSQARIQAILGGPEPADDPATSSAADATAQAEAHLLSLGWSKSDIARLLVGPEQSHLTAEALFRQHAANSAGDQEALIKALARAGAQRVKPDPSLLSGLNVAHLSPEEPTDLEQIISQFAALPDVQKQRFLLLLDAQKPSKKNSAPGRDGTSTPPAKTSGGSPKSAGPAGDVLPVVKSSLDLLSTALKGLLGTGKDGSKKGPSGPGGRTKTSAEDEPDSDESSSPADDDTADEDRDGSMDDVPSTEEDTSSPSDPEEPIGAGNDREPD